MSICQNVSLPIYHYTNPVIPQTITSATSAESPTTWRPTPRSRTSARLTVCPSVRPTPTAATSPPSNSTPNRKSSAPGASPVSPTHKQEKSSQTASCTDQSSRSRPLSLHSKISASCATPTAVLSSISQGQGLLVTQFLFTSPIFTVYYPLHFYILLYPQINPGIILFPHIENQPQMLEANPTKIYQLF